MITQSDSVGGKVSHMKRLLLITLLALSSGPVYAEWISVGGNDPIGMTTYVDPDTIRRKGNLVKMWQLNDFKTVQTVEENSFLSAKKQREFNCAEERTRILAATQFSGNMGTGRVVWVNSDEQKWEPIVPESIAQTLWEFACRSPRNHNNLNSR